MRLIFSWLTGILCVSPLSAQDGKWKFFVYGDTRGTWEEEPVNAALLGELVRETTNERPAFVLVPGDLVYAGGLSNFAAWTNIMAPVYQAGIGVYPVVGNHDAADLAAYQQVFGASVPQNGPEGEVGRTYAIGYSNALILVLDQYVNLEQVNTNWLETVLATNASTHVFTMGHEPAFKVVHTDCLQSYPENRAKFWNLMSNASCRVYFAGHDHFFDHMRLDDHDGDPSNDVHQYIVGTGGAPLYDDGLYDGANGGWSPVRVTHESNYGYVCVEIEGPVATLTWRHRVAPGVYAATTDVFSFSLAPKIDIRVDRTGQTLTWSGNGRLQTATSLLGPWSTMTNATSPFFIQYDDAGHTFYRVKLR